MGLLASCRGPDVRRAGLCGARPRYVRSLTASLLDDLRYDAGADGAATLADGEPQTLVHGDRLDQLDRHLDVVARHDHFRALGQVGDTGHVRGAEVELRPVAVEERSVAATVLLLEHVHRGHELGVRGDRVRLAET